MISTGAIWRPPIGWRKPQFFESLQQPEEVDSLPIDLFFQRPHMLGLQIFPRHADKVAPIGPRPCEERPPLLISVFPVRSFRM
jgi:hypothetical protein